MPEPQMPNLGDAPVTLDSQTMDELFPATPPSVPQAQFLETPPPAPQTPQTPAQSDAPYLKGSKTIYKTQEAAVEGLNAKDTLIEELRQRYALATGIDPISRQPIGQQTPQASDSYDLNPKKYLEDLQKASSAEQLAAVQKKFMWDSFAPIAPVITQGARTSAIQSVKSEIPDFDNFYNSPEYATTLERTPALREALEAAESDVRFNSRLPDLYKTAYLVHQGIQLPELLKRQTPAAQPQATRTTNQPTALAPDPNGLATRTTQADLASKEGRKRIIDEAQRKGLDTMIW